MAECKEHKLIADTLLISKGKVMLVKYKDTSSFDNQKGWFIPDDSLNEFEHPEAGAKRILREQTGAKAPKVTLGFIESIGHGTWHMIFHYYLEVARPPAIRLGKNVAQAKWFDLGKLPAAAEFSHHGWGRGIIAQIQKQRKSAK